MRTDPTHHIRIFLIAVAGLVLFFVLMSNVHPPSQISDLSTQEHIIEQSRSFLEKSDYSLDELVPFVVFRTNEGLLDQQISHFGKNRLNFFIKNGFLRFIPTWHWRVTWIATNDYEDIEITMRSFKQPVGVPVFRTVHSPDGVIQQFQLEHRQGIDKRSSVDETPDTLVFSPIETGPLAIDKPGYHLIKKYLTFTVWDNYAMKVDSLFRSDIHDEPVYNILISPHSDIFEHTTQITVAVNPVGQLLGIGQHVTINEFTSTGNDQAGIIRIIFYVLAILLLLIIFFRRLFLRLIDVRAAAIYAFIALGLCLMHLFHLLLQVSAFEQINQFLQLVAFLVTILLLCGLIGLLVFMITGLGESFSREIWPDKITSISLLRLGYFKSRLVGNSIVTGIMAAMVYLGIASIVYNFVDSSYLGPLDEQIFHTHSYMLPLWQVGIRSLFWTLVLAVGLYACFISWLAINRVRKPVLLLTGGVAFSLMTSLYLNTPHSSLVLLTGFLPGVAMTYVILKYDMLALSVSVFHFLAIWTTVDGLFISGSPDAFLAWTVLFVTAALFLAGGFLLVYGEEYEHIPELTPDYIREIAREQRVERELEIAHQVHQSFLPTDLPELPGLELAADCQPAFDVGGDYYDVIPVDDTRVAFVIGDVSGKGIQAAFYMTMVKGIFQSLVREIPEPIPLLTRMNRLFYTNARRGSFISICYGLLDLNNGTLTYARAGHNPAILLQADDNQVSMLRTTGMAIGLTNGDMFEHTLTEERTQMHTGDTLVFYTDGYTEAVDHNNRMFGDERLVEVIRHNGQLSAHDLLQHLNDHVFRFTGKQPINDDMTMVIVKFTKKGAIIAETGAPPVNMDE